MAVTSHPEVRTGTGWWQCVHRPASSGALGAPHDGYVSATIMGSPPGITDRWRSHSSGQWYHSGGILPLGSGGTPTISTARLNNALSYASPAHAPTSVARPCWWARIVPSPAAMPELRAPPNGFQISSDSSDRTPA